MRHFLLPRRGEPLGVSRMNCPSLENRAGGPYLDNSRNLGAPSSARFLRLRWAFALRANGPRTPSTRVIEQEFELEFPRRPSSLILSHDRFSAIIADQIERNSERDNVFEEKQAEIVHVMDAVNHEGVIRSRDQHGACGEEHAD